MGISEIKTKDGCTFFKHIVDPHDTGDDTLNDQKPEQKFRDMAAKYVHEKRIKEMFGSVWNIERIDDAGNLARLIVVAAR